MINGIVEYHVWWAENKVGCKYIVIRVWTWLITIAIELENR